MKISGSLGLSNTILFSIFLFSGAVLAKEKLLIDAIKKENITAVKKALKAGANVEAPDKEGLPTVVGRRKGEC